jgi:hypothetical protein
VEIGNFRLNSINSFDNFITKLHWTGTVGQNEVCAGNENLKIFPNPATGYLNVLIPEDKDILFYEIIDGFGKQVLRTDNPLEQNHIVIDIENLKPGIYIINFHSKNMVLTKKIVKQ